MLRITGSACLSAVRGHLRGIYSGFPQGRAAALPAHDFACKVLKTHWKETASYQTDTFSAAQEEHKTRRSEQYPERILSIPLKRDFLLTIPS